MQGNVNVPGVNYPEFEKQVRELNTKFDEHSHSAEDVGAAPAEHEHDYAHAEHGHDYAPSNHTHTAADVGAAPENHTHDGIGALSGYPVGSIYLSVNSTSPASLFGGTWEQLKDQFLLGAGDSYSAGATGGEATHKLTVSEMPSHKHTFARDAGGSSRYADGYTAGGSYSFDSNAETSSVGGNAAHNNMPPYLAVYMWKRIA